METIYKVTTEGDVEGKSIQTLGYCTGEREDIIKYYEDKKYYTLTLHPVDIKHISKEDANNKGKLIERKKELEKELNIINQKIK